MARQRDDTANDYFTDGQGRRVPALGLQAHNSSTGADLIDKAIEAVQIRLNPSFPQTL